MKSDKSPTGRWYREVPVGIKRAKKGVLPEILQESSFTVLGRNPDQKASKNETGRNPTRNGREIYSGS
ncbi:hypothetical protein AKJ64_03725 [candidate division MSBL1 archaeon SCGC-AAA259E17]|uniref:Uncharacterized protein n=1 Tax=candidate division MSBL1 archaeon SCGC-AAA259E17 TaxID=1698263 RepID=A0A133UDF8_9EURY|nr:hypothetical protein AKJ64_03725 [candidate division MSBL1 archaeon SCGC-AAA259E17]